MIYRQLVCIKMLFESKEKQLIDFCFLDIESGFTGNEINPGEESPLYSIEEKRKESLANDDPSAVGMY